MGQEIDIKNLKTAKEDCSATLKTTQSVYDYANMDLIRSENNRMNFASLALVFFKKVNKHWLSPVEGIQILCRVLYKYVGPVSELKPFIELLTILADNCISPHSFLTYIILPRMQEDLNWRKWQKKHITALKIIGNILIQIKKHEPFNKPVLGTESVKLIRDVVLVKYAGRSLSICDSKVLSNRDFIEQYTNLWHNFTLQETYCIYFLRCNVFNLLYTLSGRLEIQQLIKLLKQVPDIENAFHEVFPNSLSPTERTINTYQKIHLYDGDINVSLRERQDAGFSDFDYAREANGYIKIISKLLKIDNGLYLCSYFTRLLSMHKSPDIAEGLAQLVSIINSNNSRHTYTWHAEKMVSEPAQNYNRLLQMVQINGGIHPDYPSFDNVFNENYSSRELNDLLDLAEELNYQIKGNSRLTFGVLLNHYIKENPHLKDTYDAFRTGVTRGKEREWTRTFINVVDEAFPAKLHRALLKSVIKGIYFKIIQKALASLYADISLSLILHTQVLHYLG